MFPDIRQIRAELNELPFQQGKREVFVGRVSVLFEKESEASINARLREFEGALRPHGLSLSRPESDPDALFVVQRLRTLAIDISWMVEATKWVSQITTVALEMILPGLAGLWLDDRLGTGFLGLLGFAIGVPISIRHLMAMVRKKREH